MTAFITPGGKNEQLHVCDAVRGNITKYLSESGLNISFEGLVTFCKKAIEGRERAKFIFTAAVSEVISEVKALGDLLNIHAFDMSFADAKHLCSLSIASNTNTWKHSPQQAENARLGAKFPAIISALTTHLTTNCCTRNSSQRKLAGAMTEKDC